MYNVLVTNECGDAFRKTLVNEFKDSCRFEFLPVNDSPDAIKKADIIIGEPAPELILDAGRLKWVQMTFAGADMYTKKGAFPDGVLLTNVSGAFGAIISEYVIGAILENYRLFSKYRDNAKRYLWRDEGAEKTLEGRRALIFGAGDIGANIAKRLKAFDVATVGVKRDFGRIPPFFDEICGTDGAKSMIKDADIVISCLPGTAETHHLFGYDEFKALKEDAIFINVGRGSAVDTAGLVKYLNEGHGADFVLDVLETEPLISDSPLWEHKNVFITPHISGKGLGHAPGTERKVWEICTGNLRRFIAGEPLLHIVDMEKGY